MAMNGHAKSVRPLPCTELPFEAPVFESLLMIWTFFTAFGYVISETDAHSCRFMQLPGSR
jgi:hypothetical protein